MEKINKRVIEELEAQQNVDFFRAIPRDPELNRLND